MPNNHTNCMLLGLQVGHDITPGMAGVIDKTKPEEVKNLPVIKRNKLFWYQTGQILSGTIIKKILLSSWFVLFLVTTVVASAKQTEFLWLLWFTLITFGFCSFTIALVRGDILTSKYLNTRSVKRAWFTPEEYQLISKRALSPDMYNTVLPNRELLGVSLWRAMGGVYSRKRIKIELSPDELRGIVLNSVSLSSAEPDLLVQVEKLLRTLSTSDTLNENPQQILQNLQKTLRKTRQAETTCPENKPDFLRTPGRLMPTEGENSEPQVAAFHEER